jgi:hypothetical protein
MTMGTIGVHEFITLDGIIDTPTWTFDYPFDSKMGEAIAGREVNVLIPHQGDAFRDPDPASRHFLEYTLGPRP